MGNISTGRRTHFALSGYLLRLSTEKSGTISQKIQEIKVDILYEIAHLDTRVPGIRRTR